MKERLKNLKLLRLNRNVTPKTYKRRGIDANDHVQDIFKGIVKQGQNPHFCWPGSNCGTPFVLPKNAIWDVMESKPVARVESQATCAERVEGCRRQWPCRVRLYQKGSNWGFWYKQYVKVPAKQGILVLVVESFQICLIWQGFQVSWCLDQVWWGSISLHL